MAAAVTRKVLYDQIWSQPMLRLARQYGMSDVGLAKICRRHKIPCPPRGYWARKAAGQTPAQTALPNPDDDSPIQIQESGIANGPQLKDEVQEVVEENETALRIEVRDHLRGAHKLVSQARQELLARHVDSDGLITLPKDPPLDLRVSKATLRRALFLMDAILRALEDRGDAVSAGPCVTLLDVRVRFGISEIVETRREEIEPDDLDDPLGRYKFGYSRFQSKKVPSGRLTLRIHDAPGYWQRGQMWRDTPKQPLERRLESILSGLVAFAAGVRQEQERHRQEQEARAAAERSRVELARQQAARRAAIEAERRRCDDLLEDSRRWKQAEILREYIESARRAHVARHGAVEPGSEMAEWLEWASRQADRLDPLTNSPPSLLDETPGDDANNGATFR